MSKAAPLTKINFFVCSTFLDLQQYRSAVIKKLQSKAAVINAQEFFGARDQKAVDTCLEELRRSRVFIIIVGPRYGSIVLGADKSFSEVEYDEASRLGLPKFAYLIDDSAHFPIKYVSTGQDAEKLRAFKQRIMDELTINTFSNSDDLAERVYEDLTRELPKHGFELGEESNAEIVDETRAMLKGFKLMPKVFAGRTFSFPAILEYLDSPTREECSALSLRYGASLKCMYKVDKDSVLNEEFKYDKPSIFAEDAVAQQLLGISSASRITVTVKTAAGEVTKNEPLYLDERLPGAGDPRSVVIMMQTPRRLVEYVKTSELIVGFTLQEIHDLNQAS